MDDPIFPERQEETEPRRRERLAREAKALADAKAELDAGFYVDAGDIDAWLDSIGTENELPPPATKRF